jgi:hypothetical protein
MSVLLAHGPASAVKSAILQSLGTLAEQLSSAEAHNVASFFSGRGQGPATTCSPFLHTNSLSTCMACAPMLMKSLRRNPTLPTKSMDVQLRTLIIEPFQQLESFRSHIQTVIGLDECHGDRTQESIRQLICDALIEHKLPLRFLIASHRELHIRDGFDDDPPTY